jgi:hypothetical protein
MQTFYVYLHKRETDNTIFYVGKGKGRRAWSRSCRNRHWKIISAKHGVLVEIFKDSMSEVCALTLERIIIASIGIQNLANVTDGGGGISGYRHTHEAKEKISASGRGRPQHPNSLKALIQRRGCKLTDDHKAKLSLAKAGIPRGPQSEETRRKISSSHIGIRPSAETLEKMSKSKIGKAVGKNSPSYDMTERRFFHQDHGEFVGTRGELILAHKLASGCISELISGKRQSVKGWRITK